jgi:hypothetical protein
VVRWSRTFVLQNGVWVDTAFDSQTMTATPVAFLSDDYFRLAAAYPELGAAFALGNQVIALADGKAYQVVAEGESVPALPELPTRVPAPTQAQTLLDAPATPIAQATKVAQGEAPTATRPQSGAATATPQADLPTESSPMCFGWVLPLGIMFFAFRRKAKR